MKTNRNKFKIIFFIAGLLLFLESSSEGSKIIVISIPKCGTWMLSKYVRLLTDKKNAIHRFTAEKIFRKYEAIPENFHKECDLPKAPEDSFHFFTPSKEILLKCINELKEDEYLIGHLVYNKGFENVLRKNNFKILFIIRDPRDQIISRIFYNKKLINDFSGLQRLSFDDLLTGYIGSNDLQKFSDLFTSHICYKDEPKEKYISNISQFYNAFLSWMDSDICYTVKFENLVGPQGGGTRQSQLQELEKIAQHLGYETNQEKIKEIAKKLFGQTTTFNDGQIKKWKKHFRQSHKNNFKEVAGSLLIDLKYEKDFNW